MAGLTGIKTVALLAGIWISLAPLPPRLAVNHQTRECTVLFGGDEYISTLPAEGWVEYYPGSGNIIETGVGTCTLSPSGEYDAFESCCRELGYTYVDRDVGRDRFTPLMWIVVAYYGVMAGGVCLAVGLAAAIIVGGIRLLRGRRRRRLESLHAAAEEAVSGDEEPE